MIPIQEKEVCAQGEAAMGWTLFASLFQTGCARECYSNCNGKATEFVNNGSNVNSKLTAIMNMLTTREPLVPVRAPVTLFFVIRPVLNIPENTVIDKSIF